MDERLRASFIPKQPLVGQDTSAPRSRRPVTTGPLLYISFGVLFIALLSLGGVFLWAKMIERSTEEKNVALSNMRERFSLADIAKYKRLNDRISVAVERLQSHRVIHPIFDLLSEITLPQVQYTSFSFSAEERPVEPVNPGFVAEGGAVEGEMADSGFYPPVPPPPPVIDNKITLEAVTDSYETISLQSRFFKNNEFILSSNFSGFSIDEETQTLTFNIEATIDPKLISYPNLIERMGSIEVEEVIDEEVESGESSESEEVGATEGEEEATVTEEEGAEEAVSEEGEEGEEVSPEEPLADETNSNE